MIPKGPIAVNILFSILPILPQYTTVVSMFFFIIPILPQHNIVVSMFFSVIPYMPQHTIIVLCHYPIYPPPILSPRAACSTSLSSGGRNGGAWEHVVVHRSSFDLMFHLLLHLILHHWVIPHLPNGIPIFPKGVCGGRCRREGV